ncbi:6564_t:CDS:2 [Gigaspora margarita]|uniref:6564_t:CDS:1 n=1 Tax=Gigaspora margarita TaxID=4874 RepID=A0ABN7VBV6_GIGMA|nr:6564_t:CDS:2 [Gigaspora margarita]
MFIIQIEKSNFNLSKLTKYLTIIQENPQTTTFYSSIHATSSAISTSTLSTQPIVLLTQSLANLLSNINTNKTFETQSFVKHTYSSKLKSYTNSLSSTLGPLTSTKNL